MLSSKTVQFAVPWRLGQLFWPIMQQNEFCRALERIALIEESLDVSKNVLHVSVDQRPAELQALK